MRKKQIHVSAVSCFWGSGNESEFCLQKLVMFHMSRDSLGDFSGNFAALCDEAM